MSGTFSITYTFHYKWIFFYIRCLVIYKITNKKHFFDQHFVLFKLAKFDNYVPTHCSPLIILSHYRLNLSTDTMTCMVASIWSFDKHVMADTFDHVSVFLLSKLLSFVDKPFGMTAYYTRVANILPVSIYTLIPVGRNDFSKWLICVVQVSSLMPIHRPTVPWMLAT